MKNDEKKVTVFLIKSFIYIFNVMSYSSGLQVVQCYSAYFGFILLLFYLLYYITLNKLPNIERINSNFSHKSKKKRESSKIVRTLNSGRSEEIHRNKK